MSCFQSRLQHPGILSRELFLVVSIFRFNKFPVVFSVEVELGAAGVVGLVVEHLPENVTCSRPSYL